MHDEAGSAREEAGESEKTMIKTNLQDKSLARPDSALGAWNPARDISDLHRIMDDLFSRAFGYTPLSTLIPNVGGFGLQPEADIYETNDKVILVCPLPGFDTNQVTVQANEHTITIEAERKELVNTDTARPFRLGYLAGMTQCQASYPLPDEINPGQISATFKNGVLHVEAPKSERARHKSVKVNVRG